MKASSETARTSRAAAPSAAPAAPSAAPPREDRHQPERRSGPTAGARRSAGRPASAGSRPGRPRPPARPSRRAGPAGETRLRVSRGKAFSSRSSASEPATRRTVTKARVSVAATAIAKMSSGGESPLTTSFSTSIGCARRSISGAATSRFSRASEAKRITRSSDSRCAPGGDRRPQRFEDRAGRLQAEDFDRLCRATSKSPPFDQQVEVAAAFGGDPLGDHQVGLGEQGVDPVVDRLRLERVLLVDQDFDLRRPRASGSRAS